MIKFFRRIRKRLLTENKFSKYLLYAIGEIVLVVIGILIALQFNNRNEQRKNLEVLTEAIKAMEDELAYNFNDANKILDFYKIQDKICKQVLFDELTIEDYRAKDLISIVSANWDVILPKIENSAIVLENEKYATKKLGPIINAVKQLEANKNLVDQQWKSLYANIEENIKKITFEASLIRLDSTSKENRFQYMLTNEDYKKIIEMYWINIQLYSDQVSKYRAQNIAVLSTIKIIQENYDKEKLERLYKGIRMNPFTPLDCSISNKSITKNNELRRGYLIGNLSDEAIKLNMINDGKIGGFYILKPNEFRNTRTEYAGLGGDYTVIAEQVDSAEKCLQKFVATNKGYLIIE